MHNSVSTMTPMPSISEHVVKFKETKNPLYLLKAIYLILRRGRTHELLYGIYCKWIHRPSIVVADHSNTQQNKSIKSILDDFHDNILFYKREFLSKAQLQEIYGDRYAIDKLPTNFGGTRAESIIEVGNCLVMGEYDMTPKCSKIAILSKNDCQINDYYEDKSGIRHIHAIHIYSDNSILVATGDRLKVLDLWSYKTTSSGVQIAFKKRLKRFLAGYTAISNIGGDFYFGTDFSARPNYIEMMNGKKFFFPEPAYTQFVMNFHTYEDRYLLSLNSNLADFGDEAIKTLSIFDTKTQQFVYCEKVELPE